MIDPNRYPEIRKPLVGLSFVSKLDGISSWSLPAGQPAHGGTCPYSIDPNTRQMDMVCQECYAQEGNYRFGMVKKFRERNKADWKRADFVERFIETLRGQPFFRWLDSGDVYSTELAVKIGQVIANTPWCRHWLPTRGYRGAQMHPLLEAIKKLPNVMVRYSSPSLLGEYQQGLHGSVVIPHPMPSTKAVFVCPAWDNKEVMCAGCRACWSKAVPVIAYIAHGRICLSHLRHMGYSVFNEPRPPKKAKPTESRAHYLRLVGGTHESRRRYKWL